MSDPKPVRHDRVEKLRKSFEVFLRECYSSTSEEVDLAFGGLHRTEQQMFVRNCVQPVFERLAYEYDGGWYDARNEGSARWAAAAIGIKEQERIALPFI